ncbi:MAG: ATP-binding protein [Aquiluna sp.]
MQQLASIATNRLEVSIRRIAAVVILVSSIEVLINGLFQLDAYPAIGGFLLGVFAVSAVLSVLSSWFNFEWRVVFRVHGAIVLGLVWILALIADPSAFSPDNKPWAWWALGVAAVVIGVSSPPRVWVAYIPILSESWFFSKQVLFDGGRYLDALLDSAYILVFGFAISGLVQLVRAGATDVDVANTAAIQSAIDKASLDAIERERSRLDALVHDQVLHTLLLAARAHSGVEKQAAVRSATVAIESLQRAEDEVATIGSVTPLGLFKAIEKAALDLDPRVAVTSRGGGSENLDPEVAQALTEATLQALDNAIQHSQAKTIELLLDSPEEYSLVFEIVDDGIGFRLDRATRDRIGIRTSIQARVESVGGQAEIESAPGMGVKVSLRWRNA